MSKNKGSCNLYECTDMGCQNFGSSNRTRYDRCAYQKELYESTSPLSFKLYEGQFENCDKCMYKNQFWRPFDLVDVESELLNITRPLTRCPQFKYNPGCERSRSCFSTFEKNVPVVVHRDVCPVVYNNIPKMTDPGYRLPDQDFCSKR